MPTAALHSSYWIDPQTFTRDSDEVSPLTKALRLTTLRRAIANFVTILTGRNDLTVEFVSSNKTSYTTGNVIVIAADADPSKFDSAVGLALHEAAHVLLSDFTVLQYIHAMRNTYDPLRQYPRVRTEQNTFTVLPTTRGFGSAAYDVLHPDLVARLPQPTPEGFSAAAADEGRETLRTMLEHIQVLMNVLEDRYIDQYVYRRAAGYRPYYDALYDRFFYTAEIGKNLKFNPAWRDLTVDNYVNRLLYAFHPDASPDAMPGLRALIQQMDLSTIDRLGDRSSVWYTRARTQEEFSITYDEMPLLWREANALYRTILTYTGVPIYEPSLNSMPATPAAGGDGDTPNTASSPADTTEAEGSEGSEGSEDSEDSEDSEGSPDASSEGAAPEAAPTPVPVEVGRGGKPGKYNEATAARQVQLAKRVMFGDAPKKKIAAKEWTTVQVIDQSRGRVEELEGFGIPKVNVFVTERVTAQMFSEDWFIFGRHLNSYVSGKTVESITRGRQLGQLLVHRLQVRNSPTTTTYTRRPKGAIDRRLLAQLGMDIENIFQRTQVDQFRPALIHLSIDASGSMHGPKWHSAQVLTVALAYVGSKMANVDVVISVRGSNDMPIISTLFDSRRDKFQTFLKYFPHIQATGGTPEGLCFHAIKDQLVKESAKYETYFVNISDGEPWFSTRKSTFSYYGPLAHKHTRTMVELFRSNNIHVLSYFVAENSHIRSEAFTAMYGEDAAFIDVTNATDVLRTLNKKLTRHP